MVELAARKEDRVELDSSLSLRKDIAERLFEYGQYPDFKSGYTVSNIITDVDALMLTQISILFTSRSIYFKEFEIAHAALTTTIFLSF